MELPEEVKRKPIRIRYWAVLVLLLGFAVASFIRGMQALTIVLFFSFVAWLYQSKITVTNVRKILGGLFTKFRYKDFEAETRPPSQEAEVTNEITEPIPQEDAKANFNEASALLAVGENMAAIEKYKTAIDIDPNFSDAYLNLGAAYLNLWNKTKRDEHLQKSIEASQKSLELAGGGYRNRINLGLAYSKLRDKEPEALKLFEEANERGSHQDPVTWGKVKMYMANMILTLAERPEGEKYTQRLPEAIGLLRESMRLLKTAGTQESMSWYHEAKQLLDSVMELEEIVAASRATAYVKILRQKNKEDSESIS